MVKGTSTTGFEFEIDEDVLDDWEVVELLCKVEENDVSAFVKATKIILGEEQIDRLKSHVRERVGKASFSIMVKEFGDILQNAQAKN